MKVIPLNENYLEPLKQYMRKYRTVHDESYLDEEDIVDFKVDKENPTYLLLDQERIIGCLSLMLTDYFIRGQKSRLRMFHCESTKLDHYKMLWGCMAPLPDDIKKIELFIPEELTEVIQILEALSFTFYRTSYVMIRRNQGPVTPSFPDGFELKPFNEGEDERAYAEVRNTAFSTLKGSETSITQEQVKDFLTEKWLVKDGMQLLWHQNEAVGIIRIIEEEDENGNYSFVAPIALMPAYQGRGLGTELLKAGIAIGQAVGRPDCMLVVNAENQQALRLYQKVGFETDMAVSCYQVNL